MMLLATVFVACSDDDDEKDDDKPTDKVKLVSKIVTSSSEGIKELEETFEYDSQEELLNTNITISMRLIVTHLNTYTGIKRSR